MNWNCPRERIDRDKYFILPLSSLFSLLKNVQKDNFVNISDRSCQRFFPFQIQLLVCLCINYIRLPWNWFLNCAFVTPRREEISQLVSCRRDETYKYTRCFAILYSLRTKKKKRTNHNPKDPNILFFQGIEWDRSKIVNSRKKWNLP